MWNLSKNRFLKTVSRCYTTSKSSVSDKKTEEVTKLVAMEKFKQKAVSVSVLGVDNPSGEYLSFLLKQNPLVSHLYLVGEKAPGIAADLDSMDTRTMICGYTDHDVEKAVKKSEIVILMGLEKQRDQEATPEAQFHREYERVIRLARICTMYASKSIIYVCVNPVSYMVPLVSAIYKKTHWYHPGRIIGSVAVHQVKLNSLLADYYKLDPAGINVPVCGGPDLDCLVPIFSRATPLATTSPDEVLLIKKYRNVGETGDVLKPIKSFKHDSESMAKAFAINRSITAIALGLLGDQNSNMVGHIRSNIFQTSSYLTSTLQVGRGGVVHNYGVPVLSRTELLLLEQALLLMYEREQLAICALEGVDKKKVVKMTS
nr:malate dehydrogenase, mitochondrial-like [Onthophagus taurus]